MPTGEDLARYDRNGAGAQYEEKHRAWFDFWGNLLRRPTEREGR